MRNSGPQAANRGGAIDPPARTRPAVTWTGLWAGPVVAGACYFALPSEFRTADGDLAEFSGAGRATLAVMVWMGVWWLTEAIPIYATALLPLAVFPFLGIADMKAASAPYGDPLIFLFMGGFLLALSMQKWGLGKRIALSSLRIVGTRPANMVAGFMMTTAVLSAFVSNTATAAMMLPIAISVIRLVETENQSQQPEGLANHTNFATCLMLGIAYAASIGGIATIIGTPPNVFLVSFLRDSAGEPYRTEISFAGWLLIGVPLAAAFLPITFALLAYVLYPLGTREIAGGAELIRGELARLGPARRGEWATLLVFALTALLWMVRPLLAEASPIFAGLTDPGIVMMAALALFVIPVDVPRREFVMDWKTALGLPWGILILFGGGLSLAAAVQSNGVAEFLGSQAGIAGGMPPIVVVLVVTAGMIFLTELTSNTATAATLVPVLAALAPGLGLHPYLLIFPAALAASCAFMLPVATPPNAIVFGSGRVTIGQLVKAGFWLNVIAIFLVTLLTMLLVRPLFVPS